MLSVGDEVLISDEDAANEAGTPFRRFFKEKTPLTITLIDPDEEYYPYRVICEGESSHFSGDELIPYKKDQRFLDSLYKEV